MPETHKLSFLLVPEMESDRFKAAKESEWFNSLKYHVRFVAAFQIVIWNSGAQVMNMMKTDVA
jgi:hypothetical protein